MTAAAARARVTLLRNRDQGPPNGKRPALRATTHHAACGTDCNKTTSLVFMKAKAVLWSLHQGGEQGSPLKAAAGAGAGQRTTPATAGHGACMLD